MTYDKDEQTGDIVATQTAYLDRSIEKYGITNEMPKETPMESKFNITMDMVCDTPTEKNTHLYRSIIGTLMYMAVWTRPDIATAVNMLA